jgi:pimeloyl-ACP methyl ester carboxylesterase
MPVLILVGEQDTPFLPAAHRMAETIPGARLEVITDAGHSPQFEATEAWWSALTAFLDRARSGSDPAQPAAPPASR